MSLIKEHWPKILDVAWKVGILVALILNAYLRVNFITKADYISDRKDVAASINALTSAINGMTVTLAKMQERDERIMERLTSVENRQNRTNR